MDLGAKLKQARLEAGLSQRQLCGDVITRNMLSQIENGSARPSMDTLQYLAAQLGKPVSIFLEEQVAASPNQALMEQARTASGQAVLELLSQYQAPDEIYDRERWLLETLTCLDLAEGALKENRKAYAGALLEQAEKAGRNTPYYTQETQRRKQLLAYEAGLLEEIHPNEQELTLFAKSYLAQNAPEKCIGILQALDIYGDVHHLMLGEAYLQLSQYENAILHFQQAEHYNPQAVYAGLEKCYSALEDFKQAYFYACKQRP